MAATVTDMARDAAVDKLMDALTKSSDPASRGVVKRGLEAVGQRFEALEQRVEGGFGAVATRLDDQDKALLEIGEDIRGIQCDIGEIKTRLGAVEQKVEGVAVRLRKFEESAFRQFLEVNKRFDAMDTRFDVVMEKLASIEDRI